MFQIKSIKKLALAVASCSLMNVFSFGMPVLVGNAEAVIETKTFNFDDGLLPGEFDSTSFSVENGMLKANGAGSSFTFADIPANCSFQFKIKSLDDAIIPGFYADFGNVEISYAEDYVTDGWNDSIVMYNRKTWTQVIKQWADGKQNRPLGSFFPANENGYTVKYVAEDNIHSLYINDTQIITGECAVQLSDYNIRFGISSSAMTGVYLDDIVIGDPVIDSEETPNSGECAYDFEDGKLPDVFDSTKFSIENGKLKTIAEDSAFKISDAPKNCSFEFKIKSVDNAAIPKFNVELGNASITYKNDYSDNSEWDDNIKMYNRTTWATVGTAWANGSGNMPADTFFPDNGKEYKLRYVSYEDTHKLYIDNLLVLSGECTGMMSSYNVALTLFNAIDGVYLDDIIVKELTEEPQEPQEPEEKPSKTGNTYTYTFNDGKLPSEFSAEVFSIEDDRLRVNANTGSFKFTDVPKNASIEFKIEPAEGCIIPHLSLTLRTCEFSYTANNVQDKTWDDCFKLRNTEKNWEQFGDAWAEGSFFPEKAGGHTVKYIADGDTYSLYIDNIEIVSAVCTTESDKEFFDLAFVYTNGKGALENIGFYLDNIVVKGLYDKSAAGEPSLPTLSPTESTELYVQSFDELTSVPSAGKGKDYKGSRIEDGNLCVIAGEGFIIPSVYSNHRLDMDIQSKEQDSLDITIAMKKNQAGYRYEVVYEDTDTSTPGSKWIFIKNDVNGKEILKTVERNVDDITQTQSRNLSIECFSNRLAVYIDDKLVAEAPVSMLNGVDYSSWAYTEFYQEKTSDNEEAMLINNISLIGFPMNISDAVSCTEQVFINKDNEVITSTSELKPGKVKVNAKVSSIDSDTSRDITAIMVVFKDGYMIKATAKPISLPKMRLLPAENIPIELEIEVSETDLGGGNTQIGFYLWDSLKGMTSCCGLSSLGDTYEPRIDENNILKLEGTTTEGNTPVTLEIYESGKDIDNLNLSNLSDIFYYICELVSDSNGDYKFNVPLKGVEKQFKVRIKEGNSSIEEKTIDFKNSIADEAYGELMSANTMGAVKAAVNKFLSAVEFSFDLYDNNKSDIENSDAFYSVINNAKNTDATSQNNLVSLAQYASVLYVLGDAGDIDEFKAIFNQYNDLIFRYDGKLKQLFNNEQYVNDSIKADIMQTLYNKKLSNNNLFEDKEKFAYLLTESIILSCCANNRGYAIFDDVIDILADMYVNDSTFMSSYNRYKSFIQSKKNDTALEIIGHSFDIIGEIRDRFIEVTAVTGIVGTGGTAGGGNGGGSGGNGGFRAGSSNAAFVPVNNARTTISVNVPDKKNIVVEFNDLSNVAWAKESILDLASREIINGKEKNVFSPLDYVTREEFIKMLVSSLGISVGNDKCSFNDVAENTWYYKYVATGYANGIINGIDDVTFGQGRFISRQDIATMVGRAMKKAGFNMNTQNNTYFADDNEISGYAKEIVYSLKTSGIINGKENNMFDPSGSTTRAEAAKIISSMIGCIEASYQAK